MEEMQGQEPRDIWADKGTKVWDPHELEKQLREGSEDELEINLESDSDDLEGDFDELEADSDDLEGGSDRSESEESKANSDEAEDDELIKLLLTIGKSDQTHFS